MDRRKFLKRSIDSAKILSLAGLTGCAALDRYFEIEKSDYSKEVLIFGGGISGLATAYFLKKNEVPYRVFEGSNRIGGRVLSQRFAQPIGAIEMGARYVDALDQEALELVKEMNLEWEDSSIQKNGPFFSLGKETLSYKSIMTTYAPTIKLWNKELARVRRLTDLMVAARDDESSMGELESYDKIAFSEILNDSKLDFKGRAIFKNWAEVYFQKSVMEISFLEWLYYLEKLTQSSQKMYLSGGLSQFIDILGQRVSGVIPNYNMQVETKLVEIARSKDQWECKIQTKEGLKKLSSPFVVLALPLNQLKFIKGIENVFTNQSFKAAIAKAQFKTRHRIVFKTNQKSTKENGLYFSLENTRFQVTKDNFIYSLDTELASDFTTSVQIKNQMVQMFGIKDFEEVNQYSWTQNKSIGGSELKISADMLLPIRAAYLENWSRISLQLAGDYLISPESPSLNDSIKTALRASKYLTDLVREKEYI